MNDTGRPASGEPAPRRIKVFFLIGTLEVGGTESQLVELASRFERTSFDVIVCVMKNGGALIAPLLARGVRTETLGFTSLRQAPWRDRPRAVFNAMRGTWRLWRLLRCERPDIVHGMLVPAYLLATSAARLAGIGVNVSSRRSLGLFKEDKTAYLLLERIADRFTDLFIANSEAVRADTLRREPVPASKIIVIHNGLDFGRLDAAVPATELASTDRPRVIVVSNLLAYKGHEFFLRAWREVVRRAPTAVALLVGDGPMRARLERQCRDLGIEDRVRFLGVRNDVPSLLAASDLYVHASLQEGYSNALLEAMAAGLPVVATAVGGNVEAIEDGVTGYLVPAKDAEALASAMARVLSDLRGARQLGARAAAAVRARHRMGDVVQAYEAVYRRLAFPGPAGATVPDPASSATAHAGADR